jgi:hypothetical protein
MSDRGAFGKMIGADYEQVYNAILTDVTQVGLAVSQLTVERKIRIMGALAGSTADNRERNLLVASAVYSTGEMVRNSHFMPIFVKANLLMMRYFENRDFSKLDKIKAQLVHFYSPYEMLTTIMEGALQKFDLYFSQWHTLTTMGLRPPERGEEEMTWMAADETAMDAAVQEQDVARKRAQEAGRRTTEGSIPDFKKAFAEARIMAERFNTLGIEAVDIEVPDIDELNKQIKTLTEELAKLKKDDKTDAGK